MTLVVAPHFDDAVLSTAHVLLAGGADVTVLTVCGGPPEEGVCSEWDEICGFTSGTGACAERAQEDLRANAIAGVRSVHLGVSDGEYRTEFPTDAAREQLVAALPRDGAVWLPAGIGSHPDHLAIKEIVLDLVPRESGRIRFYADCPYAFVYGWDVGDDARDDDHRWARHVERNERYLGRARSQTIYLGDDAMRLKLAMVNCHVSQVRGMLPELPGFTDLGGPLRREMYWTAT